MRIAAERRKNEMSELEQCTFKPEINQEILDNRDETVVVKGLGRHLELQELKKKQEEEKKLREAEVFGINHKFAVNADEYDINNPNRYNLLPSSMNNSLLQGTGNCQLGTTVP